MPRIRAGAAGCIAAPPRILHGREDALLPVAEVEVLHGVARDVRAQILESASHVITLSHPEEIVAAVFDAGR